MMPTKSGETAMIILSARRTWITLRKLRSIQATPVLAQTMIMAGETNMAISPKYQDHYFDFTLIDDDSDLLEASYALRYQIYCQEQKFLPVEHYPDGIETDNFDPYSIHIGTIARREHQVVGTCRMVKPNIHGLPMNEHCVYTEDSIRNLGFDSAAALTSDPRTVEIIPHGCQRKLPPPHQRRSLRP